MAKTTTSASVAASPLAAASPAPWRRKRAGRIIRCRRPRLRYRGVDHPIPARLNALDIAENARIEFRSRYHRRCFRMCRSGKNYQRCAGQNRAVRALFMNTMFYASVMVAEAVSCSFIAYGFARLRAPGKNALFVLVLATMMLPTWVTLIPQYIMFSKIGWLEFVQAADCAALVWQRLPDLLAAPVLPRAAERLRGGGADRWRELPEDLGADHHPAVAAGTWRGDDHELYVPLPGFRRAADLYQFADQLPDWRWVCSSSGHLSAAHASTC